MKTTKILTVRAAMDDADNFYSIREEDAIALLDVPYEKRWQEFIKVAKEARVHSTSEEDLYIDASGNRSDRAFWTEEGEEAWAGTLGEEYKAIVSVKLVDDSTCKQAGIERSNLGDHEYLIYATSAFKAGEYALDKFHATVPIKVLDRVEVEASAKLKE